MTELRPIETRYKGYRFRSRLEARWAVFFDALGTSWEYEPEGFELPGRISYLPDFKLGECLWLEVKGKEPSEPEQQKAELLAQASGLPVAIGIGQPMFGDLWVYCMDSCDSGGGWNWWLGPTWRALKDENLLCIGIDVGRSDRTFVDGDWSVSGIIARLDETEYSSTIARAAESARAARFEHGESGAPKPKPILHRESWAHVPPIKPAKVPANDAGAVASRWDEIRTTALARFPFVGRALEYVFPARLLPGGVLEVEADPFEPLSAAVVGSIIDDVPLCAGLVADRFTGISRVVVHLYPTQIKSLING